MAHDANLAAQGIVHAEVYISVGVIYMWRNFDPRCFEPIFASLERARERARPRTRPLALLDLRRRPPFHRRRSRPRLPQSRRNARSLPLHRRHRPRRRRAPNRLRAFPPPLRPRPIRRPAPNQPRRRNHRPRSHLGSTRHRLRANRPRPICHPGRESPPRAKSAERRRSSSTPLPTSAPASAPPLPPIPCASISIAAFSSRSTPTIPPSSAPISSTSSSSPIPSRDLPATSSASWPPTPSSPAFFPNQKKPLGWPKLTLSHDYLRVFRASLLRTHHPTCAIMGA